MRPDSSAHDDVVWATSRSGFGITLGLFAAVVLTFGATTALELAAPAQAQAQSRLAEEQAQTSKTRKKRTTTKKRKKIFTRKGRKGRGGLYLRYGLGFGGCLDDAPATCPTQSQPSEGGGVNTEFGPGFIDFEIGYRPRPGVFGVELQISRNEYELISNDNRQFEAAFLFGGLGVKLFPLTKGNVDPYVGLRIGGMTVTRDNTVDPLEEGFMFSVLGGVDYLFNRHFGIGGSLGGHWLQGQEETSSFWTSRLSLIVYFDVTGGRSRSKTKTRRRTPPPKPKPRY